MNSGLVSVEAGSSPPAGRAAAADRPAHFLEGDRNVGAAAAVASTFGAAASNVSPQYAGYVMDNYAANEDCWWVPDAKQQRVMAAVGAGTFAAGAVFGALLAKANVDPEGAILDFELLIAGSAGVGAASTFGDSAESAYQTGRNLMENRGNQIDEQ